MMLPMIVDIEAIFTEQISRRATTYPRGPVRYRRYAGPASRTIDEDQAKAGLTQGE